MNSSKNTTEQQLRERAEQILAEGTANVSDASFKHIRDYIHELQVYQVELEMQAEELRRTQNELMASRDEYSELYHHSPVGHLTINDTGIILKANHTFAAMIGEDPNMLISSPLSRHVLSDDQAVLFSVIQKAASSERVRTCEICFIRRDHSTFFGRLDIRPKAEGQRAEPAVRVSVTDISEKKKAEQQKLRLEREMLKAQKEDSLRRLAGGIAHNFNNLLTVVMGNLELIRDGAPLSDLHQECLAQAHHASLKAAHLSTLMLSYLGQSKSRPSPIDLIPTVENLLSIIRSTVHGQLHLHFEHAEEPVHIEGDPSQIAQVVNNLIANAVEAIDQQAGQVTIRVSHRYVEDTTLLTIGQNEELPAGDYACIEVADTGCGMSPEALEKAIEPFFTTKFTGRGLGLSAVWGIVRAHKGSFSLRSDRRNGTTASVLLPCCSPRPTRPEKIPAASSLVTSSPKKSILYADDDRIVLGIGKMILEDMGYTVIQAFGGKEAVELFRSHRDDIVCVVLDFAMPDQDGNWTLVQIRQMEPKIPALLVSGYLREQTVNQFLAEKPNAFLQKPFTKKGFKLALEEMFINNRNRCSTSYRE